MDIPAGLYDDRIFYVRHVKNRVRSDLIFLTHVKYDLALPQILPSPHAVYESN